MKNILVIKLYVLLLVLFAGCISNAQTEENQVTYNSVSQDMDTNKTTSSSYTSNQTQNLAMGHKEIRRILGSDIGQMQFDTTAANSFRTFMTNTLLKTTSNNSDRGYNTTHQVSGYGQIQFCADGTYLETLSSEVYVDTEGASASSSGASYQPGYWEVAALPNGTFIILFYSTHPSMLEVSANGFLPWVVPKYGEDFVSLPSGELYRRIANSYCN